MLPFIFLKREYAQEPRSIITPKSLASAIVVCCLVGFGLPLIFRNHTKAHNKDAYVAGLRINAQDRYSLKLDNGEIDFSIILNGTYYEIVGKCKYLKYPISINSDIKIFLDGNPVEVWLFENGRRQNSPYPIAISEKYIRWRCCQFAIGNGSTAELVLERDFISGSAYTKCQLSYLR